VRIFHIKKCFGARFFLSVRGYYQFIGREIFQQKRVDKGPSRESATRLAEPTDIRMFVGGNEEALTTSEISEE
jgi:hypothetical protein